MKDNRKGTACYVVKNKITLSLKNIRTLLCENLENRSDLTRKSLSDAFLNGKFF